MFLTFNSKNFSFFKFSVKNYFLTLLSSVVVEASVSKISKAWKKPAKINLVLRGWGGGRRGGEARTCLILFGSGKGATVHLITKSILANAHSHLVFSDYFWSIRIWPQPCSLWFFLQSYQWFPNLSRTCGNHLLDEQSSQQHHTRCLFWVCRPPSIRLPNLHWTDGNHLYLQHNLLTNITQDAFTRYVDLLPLDLPEAS